MKKHTFDTSKPHYHYCSHCWQRIYCEAKDCEIQRYAECLACRRGEAVERYSFKNDIFRTVAGYRHTWPGRDDD